MSFQNLPPEIVLKIGKLLTSEKDFVSFTLTDRRTFLFFSRENAMWREKLDDYDRVIFFRIKDQKMVQVSGSRISLFEFFSLGFIFIVLLLILHTI